MIELKTFLGSYESHDQSEGGRTERRIAWNFVFNPVCNLGSSIVSWFQQSGLRNYSELSQESGGSRSQQIRRKQVLILTAVASILLVFVCSSWRRKLRTRSRRHHRAESQSTTARTSLDNVCRTSQIQPRSSDEVPLWTMEFRLEGSFEKFDKFGHTVALSADGTILVVGAPMRESNETRQLTGIVRTYHFTENQWLPLGAPLIAPPSSNGGAGYSLALSGDGSTLVVPIFRFNSEGYVQVYQLEQHEWQQIGSNITVESINGNDVEIVGYDTSISFSGDTLGLAMVTHPTQNGQKDTRSFNRFVLVYEKKCQKSAENEEGCIQYDWLQRGQTIPHMPQHTKSMALGMSLSADGNHLALSGFGETPANSYSYDESARAWRNTTIEFQTPGVITSGYQAGSVSTTCYGDTVAVVGCNPSSRKSWRPITVAVFEDSANWTQVFHDETFDPFKNARSISTVDNRCLDANHVVVSQNGQFMVVGDKTYKPEANFPDIGQVRVYRREENGWVKVRTLDRRDRKDTFGESLAIAYDGSVLAVGGSHSHELTRIGYVAIFRIS